MTGGCLCLDEFHVVDIGDAMILAGLLRSLFEQGIVLVTTSNVAPDSLYRDGIQRASFLPAIDLAEYPTPRSWSWAATVTIAR